MKRATAALTLALLAMSAAFGYAQESSSGQPSAPPAIAPVPAAPSLPASPSAPAIPSVPPIPAVPALPRPQQGLVLSGDLEGDYTFYSNRTASPLFGLQYYGQGLSDYTSSYLLDFYLNGDYRSGDVGVHFKTRTQYAPDSSIDVSLYELYGSLSLSDSSLLRIGKVMYSWGKGYAFNPVGYVNPKKDPTNPSLAHAGIDSLSYEYSKSLASKALQNIAADLILVPSPNLFNNDISEIADTDVAAKLYFLLWNTDIDLAGYYSRTNGKKAGFDFSRNIVSNLEIHGELSYFTDQPGYLIANGVLQSEQQSGLSYLAGLRWLNALNMTTILEYYHNGAGMTESEFTDYLAFLSKAVASNNPSTVVQAMNLNSSHFSNVAQMQDYLYLNVSWPAPLDLLDFTPSAFVIYNIADESLVVGAPLAFSPVTNFTLTLQPTLFFGASGTEFGSKPYWGKVDLEADFAF